jgi:hypothetical protein
MRGTARHGITGWIGSLGALRLCLCAVVISLVAIAPFSGGQARYEGFAFVTTVLAPAFFVMFLFIVPLDLAMTRIFMSDKTGPERTRYRRVLWVEGSLLLALVASWAPLVVKLLRLS